MFSRGEITSHYDALGILENHDIPDLLTRSTENTRTGNEFSFKLCALTIGVAVGQQFYCGFIADVDSHGVNIQSKKRKKIPSTFWMRFHEQVRECHNTMSSYLSDVYGSGSRYERSVRDIAPVIQVLRLMNVASPSVMSFQEESSCGLSTTRNANGWQFSCLSRLDIRPVTHIVCRTLPITGKS